VVVRLEFADRSPEVNLANVGLVFAVMAALARGLSDSRDRQERQ
jgi:hypothetical protein